jgi:hypothetical protein
MIRMVPVLLLLVLSSCLAFDPGGQVRRGLGQKKIYEWKADGGVWVEGEGPQTESFTMMEGSIVIGDDGEVDWEQSRVTHYLRSDPSGRAAQGAMVAAFAASTEQTKAFSATVEKLVETIVPLLTPIPSPPEAPSETPPVLPVIEGLLPP